MLKLPDKIAISEYQYGLPEDRIAKYPVPERDMSNLLVYRSSEGIKQDKFMNIGEYLPEESILIFNNTKVVYARLYFKKVTGATVELFCLRPFEPADYALIFQTKGICAWECIIGNAKRWKSGTLSKELEINGQKVVLTASKIRKVGDDGSWQVGFSWDNSNIPFSKILEHAGHIPIPPYLNREAEKSDLTDYQTVYSRIEGSVAAPTAGLHFTDRVFKSLEKKQIKTLELTLHVGAGTFQPVKHDEVSKHVMHEEEVSVRADLLDSLGEYAEKTIAVGTTSVRSLESIYWLGVKLGSGYEPENDMFYLGQWECYDLKGNLSLSESLGILKQWMLKRQLTQLNFITAIIIVPGYQFRIVKKGMITNFHQPGSTLLLLIAAYTGEKWREIYNYALDNGFRFLSYGDSSLLLRG
ncbi:MAG: S-adenosylmethionine:tRNA ribosyltransferase-isomerase [Bacteroidales bacterium]|nr:S-adenosylmethionine:tRNA ribosyltransferase-isomerase [Bacteroidales bacterium]